MKPVSADSVCIRFQRAPDSLIEEPEVCELCLFWRDGLCAEGEPSESPKDLPREK